MKAYFTGISIFILAISVISSAIIISKSTNIVSDSTVAASTDNGNQLLSKEQASEYLGISVEEFDVLDRNQIASFGEGIPFLNINGNKYYTILTLEKWLADTSHYLSNELSDFY